jgi:hypothetical protein
MMAVDKSGKIIILVNIENIEVNDALFLLFLLIPQREITCKDIPSNTKCYKRYKTTFPGKYMNLCVTKHVKIYNKKLCGLRGYLQPLGERRIRGKEM